MKELLVSLERSGRMVPTGMISGEDPGDACFRYLEQYLKDPDATALSVSLPLSEKSFSSLRTKNFFSGLLPEGYTRKAVAQWMHIQENDYLTMLHNLGKECLGAVSITEPGDESYAYYEPVTDEQIQKLAAEGALRTTEMVVKAHLSLTGASGKVGLYLNPRPL